MLALVSVVVRAVEVVYVTEVVKVVNTVVVMMALSGMVKFGSKTFTSSHLYSIIIVHDVGVSDCIVAAVVISQLMQQWLQT